MGPDRSGRSSRPEPIAAAFERLSNGVATLVRDHLELAKIELREGVRSLTQDALVIGAGLGLLLVAHLLLMAALALGLAHWMPAWLAFLAVALANLGAGAALVAARLRQVRLRKVQATSVALVKSQVNELLPASPRAQS